LLEEAERARAAVAAPGLAALQALEAPAQGTLRVLQAVALLLDAPGGVPAAQGESLAERPLPPWRAIRRRLRARGALLAALARLNAREVCSEALREVEARCLPFFPAEASAYNGGGSSGAPAHTGGAAADAPAAAAAAAATARSLARWATAVAALARVHAAAAPQLTRLRALLAERERLASGLAAGEAAVRSLEAQRSELARELLAAQEALLRTSAVDQSGAED
jgi:hypothetical protein